MGRCHDFGVEVRAGCEHPMQAAVNACVCPDCDSVCEGQFKGCADVWARGPRPVEVRSSTVGNGHGAGNGQLPSAPKRASDPLHAAAAPSEARAPAHGGTEPSTKVVDWPDLSTHALRTDLEALSGAVRHQQGVVTQLVAAYSDLRRDSGREPLLMLVREVVEEALGRHEALLREAMARDSRRLNDVACDVNELRREYRADQSIANSGREQLRTELESALGRQRSEISELLTADRSRLDDVVAQISELTAEQRAQRGDVSAVQEEFRTELHNALARQQAEIAELLKAGTGQLDQVVAKVEQLTADQHAHFTILTTSEQALRTELDDALRQERVRACEAMAANADLVNEAIKEAREVVTSVSTAAMSEIREENVRIRTLLSDLEDSLTSVQDSTRNDREATRRLMSEKVDAFAVSMGDVVRETVGQAVEQSEDRTTVRLETAIGGVRQSLKDAEEVSKGQMRQAARAERDRLRELQTCLGELREALEGTHALAAAQQEETELLDGAMSTLQESLVDLRNSLATQHLEIREDLARQRRSSSALLKRQLRPIVESLPVLVAAAVEEREDESVQRIERAVAKLRRSLQQPSATRSRTEE
jgi:hypothetical protein